jgi:dimethyladenosine transferase
MKGRIEKASDTIDIIKEHGFVFQKKYGQNFLIDSHVLDKIISAADISEEDVVIEIGPGIGVLSQRIAEKAHKLIAIEIDKNLMPILAKTLFAYENVVLLNEDVLKVDLEALIKKEAEGKRVKVVANLPYYITTPIIMDLLERKLKLDSITVMIQKEVAQRLIAKPGTKEYGAISLAVAYYTDAVIVANVPPNSFIPRPSVSSAVIRLKLHEKAPVEPKDEKLMFALIRASFNQRRKTLQNSLNNASGITFTKEVIAKAIRDSGFDERVRGETLSLEDFVVLSDRLSKL